MAANPCFFILMAMRTLPAVLQLIERAYADEPDETAWLSGILDAAKNAFRSQVAAQAYTATLQPDGDIVFHSLIGDDTINERMLRMIDVARGNDPSLIRKQFFEGPVLSVRRSLSFDRQGEVTKMFDSGLQNYDAVSAQGVDPSGRACAISWVHATDQRISSEVRGSLARIAAHLTSAYRLRYRPRGDVTVVEGAADARWGDSLDARAKVNLRTAALAIDQARQQAGSSPDEALAIWRALVDGKWTLVDRIARGDRRVFVARPNEPSTLGIHALDAPEQQIISLAVLCRPSKLIAYELGISEGEVSRALTRALSKMGLRSRAELVEMYGALVGKIPAD